MPTIGRPTSKRVRGAAEELALAANYTALMMDGEDAPPKSQRKPRRRARLTCQKGHIWLLRGASLDLRGKNDSGYWEQQRCPECGGRVMAAIVLKKGLPAQEEAFCWTVRISGLRPMIHRLSPREERLAMERLHKGLRGGGNQPILTRAKANGKRTGQTGQPARQTSRK